MPQPHLTVWYNTRCPVCDAGIDRQRNKLLALVKAGAIEFRRRRPPSGRRRRGHCSVAYDAGRGSAGDAARQSGRAAGDAVCV